MTRDEHIAEAERLIDVAGHSTHQQDLILGAAQAHALIAIAMDGKRLNLGVG